MSCGCSGADCSCNFQAGEGMTVTGNGSKSNPYVITASGGASNLNTADTSSLVWTETGSGTPSAPITLSANVALSVPAPSLNTYTANATWTKPGGVTRVRVIMAGGGGGGAGGGMQGGSQAGDFLAALGGQGGGYTIREFAASDLPATVAITVGQGGPGGNGATGIGSGIAGGAGGASSFGTLLSVPGGAGGATTNNPALLAPGYTGHGIQGLVPGGGGWGGSIGYGGTQITNQRVNLITNPSFETNLNFWQGSCSGCNQTTTRITTDPTNWGTSLMRATGKNEDWSMHIITGGIYVTPGASYFLQGSFLRNNNANWGSVRVQPVINFIDAGGTGVGYISLPYQPMPNPNTFVLSYGNFTVPSDPRIVAALLQFSIQNWNIKNISTAMYVNVDAVLLEQGSATQFDNYFDGSYPATATTSYSWTGTAHNSASVATTIGGLSVFTGGGPGTGVPIPPLAGGYGGSGGGTGLSPAAVNPGGIGGNGQASPLTSTKPGGGGGGGGGAGSTPGYGGNGVVGGGGGGGGAGLSPQVGGKGGNGGQGFVTVIAW